MATVSTRSAPSQATERARAPLTPADVGVLALLAALGLLQLYFCRRAPDFPADSVFYADAARTLLSKGQYLMTGKPETVLPPGFSLLISLLCLAESCGYTALLRAMVVAQTVGLACAYLLFRKLVPRVVAGAIVLLIASSPVYFTTVTRALVPNSPVMMYVLGALLLVSGLERARSRRARVAGAALLAALCGAAVLTTTAAIALVGALALRIGIVWVRDREEGRALLRLFLPAIVLGLAVQAYLMTRGPQPLDWPEVAGFPRPYFDQLKVKVGNYPELGMATARDIPARVLRNIGGQGAQVTELLTSVPWVNGAWMSIAVAPIAILVLLGWVTSVRRTGGGVHDWFFAGNEFIYLLWPWYTEFRYFLQAMPLACLYAWLGVVALASFARRRPRVTGLVSAVVCLLLAGASRQWTQGVGLGQGLPHGGLQDAASVYAWLALAFASIGLIVFGARWSRSIEMVVSRLSAALGAGDGGARRLATAAVSVAVVPLLGLGLVQDVRHGWPAIEANSALNAPSGDIQAALWLKEHAEPGALVMARHAPTVYHYAAHPVVWFPPSSDAGVLMRGIRRLNVDYVVVVHRQDDYYLPTEDSCFSALVAAYPDALRPVFENSSFRVLRYTRR